MQTVVLAAGAGTRMRPLTDDRPKPLLPVADRSLLEHVLTAATAAGASRLVIVVGYESDQIRLSIGDEYAGVPVEYAVQERVAGTADAVRTAREHLTDDPFVVLNGDNWFDANSLSELYERAPAIASYRVADPTAYGVLSVENERVIGVVEKPSDPPSNLINAGAYAFPAAALAWLDVEESARGERELTDVLDRVIERYDVTAIELDHWLDVGRTWELLEVTGLALEELERRLDGEVHDAATIRGPVVIESEAVVREGVTIEGPALIREGAHVGPNAYVRGTTVIGEDARVGHAVEIKNSVLMEGAHVSHLSYVGDSVLGREVNFGAGTQVGNLRHDGEPVAVTVKGERVSTGRRKFGVVCGDRVKTGINTSLNPGVTLGTDVTTTPGEIITRDR